MKLVLDAWAILAYLQKEEPAALRIRQTLIDAEQGHNQLFVSTVNLGEVFYRIGKRKGEKASHETMEELKYLPITVLSVDDELVFKSARLKIYHPISYADAFAASTAKHLNATLLTGDPELCQLEHIISIERLVRR